MIVFAVLALCGFPVQGQVAESVSLPLAQNQYDLSNEGRAFLQHEAARASFFMLGELHGENEIPSLIQSLVYWADSYDAMIFYREVTPLGTSPEGAQR